MSLLRKTSLFSLGSICKFRSSISFTLFSPASNATRSFNTINSNHFDLIKQKKGFIIDMDGVVYHDSVLMPGAPQFVEWLKQTKKSFIFLTNSSDRTLDQLSEKLQGMGISLPPRHFFTAALATAEFVARQKPNGTAYIIGERAVKEALESKGYHLITDWKKQGVPDYVIVGETRNFTYDHIEAAVAMVRRGARLVGTNLDACDRWGDELMPGTGSLVMPIESASGRSAFFVGKPNPLMISRALSFINCTREETVVIGDRMNTDIIAGVSAEIDTVLVLSGVTRANELANYAYRPTMVVDGIWSLLEKPLDVKL